MNNYEYQYWVSYFNNNDKYEKWINIPYSEITLYASKNEIILMQKGSILYGSIARYACTKNGTPPKHKILNIDCGIFKDTLE